MKEAQVININKDTVLVFKIEGQTTREVYEETKKSLEEQVGCTCVLQGEGIELDKVLNKKELSEDEVELEDKNIIEIELTTKYVEGKPIATTMKYKYKDNIHQHIECERNIYSCGIDGGDEEYQVISYYDNNGNLVEEKIERTNNKKDKLKAIYKAEIFEYKSGRIDTMYECDKDNNDECDKKSCTNYHYCNHTSNKKYAKNYINEK